MAKAAIPPPGTGHTPPEGVTLPYVRNITAQEVAALPQTASYQNWVNSYLEQTPTGGYVQLNDNGPVASVSAESGSAGIGAWWNGLSTGPQLAIIIGGILMLRGALK